MFYNEKYFLVFGIRLLWFAVSVAFSNLSLSHRINFFHHFSINFFSHELDTESAAFAQKKLIKYSISYISILFFHFQRGSAFQQNENGDQPVHSQSGVRRRVLPYRPANPDLHNASQ